MVGTGYKKSVKPTIAKHFFCKLFGQTQKKPYLCIAFRNKARAFSSAGLEHLPYKQRVGGSNPSAPTQKQISLSTSKARFFALKGAAKYFYNENVT